MRRDLRRKGVCSVNGDGPDAILFCYGMQPGLSHIHPVEDASAPWPYGGLVTFLRRPITRRFSYFFAAFSIISALGSGRAESMGR